MKLEQMATNLSEPAKKRILRVCEKLFLEQGYNDAEAVQSTCHAL